MDEGSVGQSHVSVKDQSRDDTAGGTVADERDCTDVAQHMVC